MDQPSAILTLKVLANSDHDIRMRLSSVVAVSATHSQRVDVFANGALVVHETLRQAGDLDFTVPRHVLGASGILRLRFVCPDGVSPASLGVAADPRILSLGIKKLWIEEAGG